MAIIHYIEKHLTTYEVKFHSHKYWEIIYVTSGKGCLQTADGITLHYKSGDLLFVPPSVMHTNSSQTGFRNIFFSIDNWTPKISKATMISNPSSKDLLPILEQTHKYYHSQTQEKKLIFALNDVIASHLDRIFGETPINSLSLQMEAEIISNYTDPSFDIAKMYEKIPYSKEYLRKLFIKDIGVSPLQYLQQKRIDCAVRLLAIRDSFVPLNIREVSEKCGFDDQLYFSRVFKKILGISPTQYMARLGATPEPHHQWQE